MNTKNGVLRSLSAVLIARPLSAVGVTRNQISTARLVLGFVAALTLAIGPAWFSIAAAVFLAGFFLERSDNELTRIAGQFNADSNRYAFISHSASNAVVFVGLGIGMRASEYGLWSILMGLFAGLAVLILPSLVKRLEIINGEPSTEFNGVLGLDSDDVLLMVPIALWAGWTEALLIVTAFGGVAFVSAFYVTHYRKFSSY